MSDDNLEGLKVMSSGGEILIEIIMEFRVLFGTDGRNIALSGISNGDNAFRNGEQHRELL